jgi:ribosome biogenesis GTPase
MIEKIERANDCTVMPISNMTGVGLVDLKECLIPGKTYCLIGSSGVGKSTLINHLIGKDLFETKTVRESDGRGRHTTSHRQLVMLGQGSMVIDTPGMRELASIGADTAIRESFPDIEDLSAKCLFPDCSHVHEKGCAVRKAVTDGDLGEERLKNYHKLKVESEYNELSYTEKREKEKRFGKNIHNWKKMHKKFKC